MCFYPNTLTPEVPSRAIKFLEIINDSSFICKSINQEPLTPPRLLPVYHCTALITPGEHNQREFPDPRAWRIARLKPLTLPCPVSVTETTVKALAHIFPSLPLLPNQPGASPYSLHGVVPLMLFRTVSNKLSFQWQSSPDLLPLPYMNKNKTYV